MDIDEKRDLLFRTLKESIETSTEAAIQKMRGTLPYPAGSDTSAFEHLGGRLLSADDIEAFRVVARDVCMGPLMTLFAWLEGCTSLSDCFTPVLIDGETMEDLAPNDSSYNEALLDVLID